jgi:serine/threonine protein kinase
MNQHDHSGASRDDASRERAMVSVTRTQTQDHNDEYLRLSRHDTVELFSTLCELSAEDRPRHIADIAKENVELATLLEGLLAATHETRIPTRIITNLSTALNEPRTTAPLEKGMMLGDFELIEPIGRGGMGEVWRAEQHNPRRSVALKVVATNARRFSFLAGQREREALAAIRHPAIATIHAAGDTNGYSWFAVELVEDARDIVTASHALTLPQRIALIADVADAVAHAHAVGFIHRDLKPSNVLISRDGLPKVIDFGIATLATTSRTTTATRDPLARLGTPAYLPPEALSDFDGKTQHAVIDARADVRALGVLLYQCVHGVLPAPLTSDNATLVLQALPSTQFDPPPHAPRATRGDLAQIILRATEADPERRYRTMAAFSDDLRAFLASRPVQAAPRSTTGKLLLAMRRNPRGSTLAIATAFSLVAATAISTWYANYARTAALDATALVDQTSETYNAFLDIFFPKDFNPIEARELTFAELLYLRISTLERRVALTAPTNMIQSLDAPARMMQSVCLTLGLHEGAQRCALAREIIAARVEDPRGTQSSTRHFEEALTALAIDRTDPAALATIERVIPTILSERRIVRAAGLSAIGTVDYLSDVTLTEKVADLVLQQDPSNPEFALSAVSRLALNMIRTLAAGQPIDARARPRLARVNTILRQFAEGSDPAISSEAILIANAIDLEFCRIDAVLRAPELLPEFIECALIAGMPLRKSHGTREQGEVGLGWSETMPLRLLRAGHVELCRAALREIDRRDPVLRASDRRIVEWSRAELLLSDAQQLEGSARITALQKAMQILTDATALDVLNDMRVIEEAAAIYLLLGRCACELGDFTRARAVANQLRELAVHARSDHSDADRALIFERHAELVDGLIEVTSSHLQPFKQSPSTSSRQ